MSVTGVGGGAASGPERAGPVLELVGVHKGFSTGFVPKRRPVLTDVSFTVGRGEIFGFLGQNGAGKTTTIKLLVGLLLPDRGSVRIRGIDAWEPRARHALGFLPENPYFYDDLTGGEFLDFYGRLSGLTPVTRKKRTHELLERLSLASAVDVPLRRYSKGMVQRIGFAQALLASPDLLVLDEPMSGLDPIGRRDFRDLLLEVSAAGATVFFSSHILQDAEMLCHRLAILNRGRVVRTGTLVELLEGNRPSYEVGLEGPLPASLGSARRVVSSEQAGGRTIFRVDSLEAADELMERAKAGRGRVVSLVPLRATLEDLFLREVGHEVADPGRTPTSTDGGAR